jgi:hypothetical protein
MLKLGVDFCSAVNARKYRVLIPAYMTGVAQNLVVTQI